jgi:hypothetical protein
MLIDLEHSDLTEKSVIASHDMLVISNTSDLIILEKNDSLVEIEPPKKSFVSPVSPPSSQSTGVQTSPNTSWLNIPGAVDEENYYNEDNYNLKGDTDRKYFIYIIKDINPHAKKECVGRITLPTQQRVTLEQLRYHLLQSSEDSIRYAAQRKFRFLSESYRLVALNEAFTPVDEVYPTQGIFIKLNTFESNLYSSRRTKSRANEKIYGMPNKLQEKHIYGTKDLTMRRESIYGTLEDSERTRLGYHKTQKKRDFISSDKKRDKIGMYLMIVIELKHDIQYCLVHRKTSIYLSNGISANQNGIFSQNTSSFTTRRRPNGGETKFFNL